MILFLILHISQLKFFSASEVTTVGRYRNSIIIIVIIILPRESVK